MARLVLFAAGLSAFAVGLFLFVAVGKVFAGVARLCWAAVFWFFGGWFERGEIGKSRGGSLWGESVNLYGGKPLLGDGGFPPLSPRWMPKRCVAKQGPDEEF